MGLARYFDLEEQFSFYAAYHTNGINQLIHVLCIWPIYWTLLALFAGFGTQHHVLPDLSDKSDLLSADALALHLGALWTVTYTVVYPVMDPLLGSFAAVLSILCYLTSNLFVANIVEVMGMRPMVFVGAVHAVGWLAQFYGHGVHEGRRPALVDNMFQAFLAAPLFVVLEVAFKFGYRKHLQKRIQARVDRTLAGFARPRQNNAEQNRKEL